ncbi:MAG: hypothetical protein QXH12_01560 [Candidatus Caldarchaeum sp.]
MVPPVLRLDILFEALSCLFSIVIASVAFLAWRKVGAKSLFLFSMAFYLMAAAMLARIVLVSWVFSSSPPPPPMRFLPILVLQVQELVYSVVRICAYIVFLYLYAAYPLRKDSVTAFVTPVSLIYNPLFEAVSATMLTFVVYRLFKLSDQSRSSYVLSAFILLLTSHLLFLLTPVSFLLYLVAHFAQMVSLALFLTAVSLVLMHGERLSV